MITLWQDKKQVRNEAHVVVWKAITPACPPPLNRLIWLNDGATVWIGKAVRLRMAIHGEDGIAYTHTQNRVWTNSVGEWCSDYHVPSTQHNPIAWQDLPLPYTTRALPEISR